MDIIPPKQLYSKEHWASIFGAMLAAGVLWASHFVIEFGVCILQDDFSILWILMSYFGCAVGSLISFFIGNKLKHHLAYLSTTILYILSISLVILATDKIVIIMGLFLVGFFSGAVIGHLFTHLTPVFPDPKFNGRVIGWGYVFMNLLILLEIWLLQQQSPIPNLICLLIIIIIIIVFTIWGKHEYVNLEQEPITIRSLIRNKKNQPFLLIAFFWGFFLTIPIYASYLILEDKGIDQPFFTMIGIIFFVMLIGSLPAGMLLDKIGRRKVLLFGLLILSLAFISLNFQMAEWMHTYVFSSILGLGFALVLPSQAVLLIEMPDKKHLQSSISIGYFLMSTGMLGGAILGEIFKPLYLENSIYLSVILLFFMLIVAIVISQMEETLPSQSELEWKNAIQYISVIYKSGINIYSQKLNHELETDEKQNDILLGGALLAVSSILDEIAHQTQSLKVIQKEDFSILIEEREDLLVVVFTTKELQIIRKKMRLFMDEFYDFFEDLIKLNITNVTSFFTGQKTRSKNFPILLVILF